MKQRSRVIKNLKDIEDICNLYQNENWTLKLLAEKYHTTSYIIKNIIINNNITINLHLKKKNLFVKDNFFEKIDCEAKAYFLGLLFTNGNIFLGNKREAQISLEISVRDKKVLDVLKELINSEAKISYRKRTNTETVCFRIYSNKVAQDLVKYGIIPNKTKLTKHIPNNIPKEFIKDFVRGLIDGDGAIYKSWVKGKGYNHITFCSCHKTICEELQQLCDELIQDINKAKILKDNGKEIYRVHYNNQQQVKQLVTVLYKDSNYYLARKYALARDIFEDKSEDDIV